MVLYQLFSYKVGAGSDEHVWIGVEQPDDLTVTRGARAREGNRAADCISSKRSVQFVQRFVRGALGPKSL